MTLNAEAAESSGSTQPFKLNHLSYTDSVVVKRMFQHLDEIDFLGISVSVYNTYVLSTDLSRYGHIQMLFNFLTLFQGNPVNFDRNGIREINSLTVYYYKAGTN